MCITIPLKIIEVVSQTQAICEADGKTLPVDVSFIDDATPGDWVSVHMGLARSKLSEHEAQAILDALSALEKVRSGETDVDHLFADLVNREPPRPPST
ncbi:MAG: HypC/HybG/HupF family hydrogenase formation chaperone [Hydrogenophaga sp.]|nr:HypC/HybG/HupF family hydrogenase formation chaperone [Hydrogenophaga sp.]